MSRGYRILLTCLLALLLPLQGFAATTMLLCGPAHHAPSGATAMSHHELAHDAGPGGAHDHHAQAKPAGGKCSACAACCMSTAMVPATVVLPVLPLMTVHAMHFFAVPGAVISSGLERPPRSFLA